MQVRENGDVKKEKNTRFNILNRERGEQIADDACGIKGESLVKVRCVVKNQSNFLMRKDLETNNEMEAEKSGGFLNLGGIWVR